MIPRERAFRVSALDFGCYSGLGQFAAFLQRPGEAVATRSHWVLAVVSD